jgi:integrase
MAKKLSARLTGFLRLRESVYHAEKMVRGTMHYWSTQTGDLELARKRAADHWQKVIAGEFQLVDAQRVVRNCSTVGELLVAYDAMSYPAAATRTANAAKLRRIVAVGLGIDRARVDGQALSVLTSDLVRKYQAAVLGEVEGEESDEVERARFSANSMLTQARSVFASVQALKDRGVELPADKLEGFLEAERFRGVKIDTEFRPFTKAEVVALSAALERARVDNPPVWLGACLMLYCGLRNSEVVRVPAAGLREEGGAWYVRIAVEAKAEGSLRSVPVPAWLAAALREQVQPVAGGKGAPGKLWAPVLPVSERSRVMQREISTWLQRVLPAATSPSGEPRAAYDLRRQAGSLVFDAQGIEAARDFLGHRTAETTRRWYASRIRALKPIGELVGA